MKKSVFKKIKFAVIYNRTGHLNEDGQALIQIRAYLDKKSRFFSTGIYIEPEYWDKRHNRVKEAHPAEFHLNDEIHQQLQGYKRRERELCQRFGRACLRLLDDKPKEDAPVIDPFLTFTEFFREEMKRPQLQAATRLGHQTTFRYLCEFQNKVLFEELGYPFLSSFDKFLLRKGLAINTVHKHHRVLKAYVRMAVNHDYMLEDQNPYRKFKARQEEPNRVYLSREELEKLEGLRLPEEQPYLERVRKIFLLACYTGLRFGDVTKLARKHIEETAAGMVLNIRMAKTKTTLTVPICLLFRQGGAYWSKPEAIIRERLSEQKLDNRKDLLAFPLFKANNQHVNRCLKELASWADIDKNLTFHVARRTFATIMAAKVQMPVLQKMLGHKSLEMTKVYISLANDDVRRALEGANWS